MSNSPPAPVPRLNLVNPTAASSSGPPVSPSQPPRAAAPAASALPSAAVAGASHTFKSPLPWLVIASVIVLLAPWAPLYFMSLNTTSQLKDLNYRLDQAEGKLAQVGSSQEQPATAPTQESPPVATTQTKPVFRLFNPRTRDHFYTADQGEVDAAVSGGYRQEGVGFVVPVK